MFEDGVNDQHVRELQCEGRVGDGRAETADQVRGSLACAVHNGHGTARSRLLTGRCVSHDSDVWKQRQRVGVVVTGIRKLGVEVRGPGLRCDFRISIYSAHVEPPGVETS